MTQQYYKLSKAFHMFTVSSSPLKRVGQRFYNFVPAFQKLPKGGIGIVQACDSYHVSGFCASIALAFILWVELFDYVIDGGICKSLAGGAKWEILTQDGVDQTLRCHSQIVVRGGGVNPPPARGWGSEVLPGILLPGSDNLKGSDFDYLNLFQS